MGKGDGQRPRFVPYDQYAERYDRIFGQRAPASEDRVVKSEIDVPEQQTQDSGSTTYEARSRSEYRRLKAQGFEPEPPPWDDDACDKQMECLDCMQAPCNCDWQRIEDEYRED